MPSSEDKAPENFDRASHMRKVAHTPTPQKNRRRLTKERKKQRGDFFRSLVRPGWQGRLRHFCWVWLLLLVMSAMVDKVVEVPGMTSKERQEKIAGVNQATTAALNQMGGVFVTGQYFKRLEQSHGLEFGQWDAPFNAQVAEENLRTRGKKLKRLTVDLALLQDRKSSIFGEAVDLESPNPFSHLPHPKRELSHGLFRSVTVPSFASPQTAVPRDAYSQILADALEKSHQQELWKEQQHKKAEDLRRQGPAIDDQIQTCQKIKTQLESEDHPDSAHIEKLKIHTLLPSGGIIPFALNALLALPDAHLNMVRSLMPHLRWAFRLTAVAVILLAALMIAIRAKSVALAVWFLFLLPIAVSLFAGLCALIAWGFTTAFHSAAPTLSVPSSTAMTSLYWAFGKLAEHHGVEGFKSIKLIKRIIGE